MLVGICGSKGAGKATVAQFLCEKHGFRRLRIRSSDGGDDDDGTRVFPSAEALLDFITARWREPWVTTDVASEAVLDVLSRRPFFLLVSVDAPVLVRWRRIRMRVARRGGRPTATAAAPDLATFVGQSDEQLYGGGGPPSEGRPPLLPVLARAAVRLINGAFPGEDDDDGGGDAADPLAKTVVHLTVDPPASPPAPVTAALGRAGLDPAGLQVLLRPSWDRYFMALASLAAQRSNCMKRRVGCVLVREHRVVSTGYNGTPRGLRNCGEGGCGRCNNSTAGTLTTASGAALATCLCLHAEENALLEAGRERIPTASLADTTLYCDTCPCLTCSIKIVQVGIGEVVYSQSYSMDEAAAAVFREAGVRLRQFTPPTQGLIHLHAL